MADACVDPVDDRRRLRPQDVQGVKVPVEEHDAAVGQRRWLL